MISLFVLIFKLIDLVSIILFILLFARAIISWVPYSNIAVQVRKFNFLTDWLVNISRGFLRGTFFDRFPIDFSIVLSMILIEVARYILKRIILLFIF